AEDGIRAATVTGVQTCALPILIFDVKCSQVLAQELTRAGLRPTMWKTGHSLIKQKMKEVGAPLAGEMSGHMFFGGDWYGFDDARSEERRVGKEGRAEWSRRE